MLSLLWQNISWNDCGPQKAIKANQIRSVTIPAQKAFKDLHQMKGVVLAGGLGTRMGDLTRITNKHLLPVYDRPMIYYPIQYLVEAGIKDIMIVTGGEHAGDFLRLLRNGDQFGCRLHYAYQEGNTGIAAALLLAEEFVGRELVCVLLGDNLFEHGIRKLQWGYDWNEYNGVVHLSKVPDPRRFGVPVFDDESNLTTIIEKPDYVPKHGLAVVGAYFYDDSVFDLIRSLKPSARGELEITDVNNAYIYSDTLFHSTIDGWWIDCGTPDSLLRASNLVKNKEIDSAIDKDLKAVK